MGEQHEPMQFLLDPTDITGGFLDPLQSIGVACAVLFFFLMTRPPPRPTLFPYTPPFRSPREPLYDIAELDGIVTSDTRRQYDVREIIARLVDASEFDEFKHLYGTTLVTGFAHIHGIPLDRKSTRLHSSHQITSYALFSSN